ncbi:hypothetical protein B7463_g11932, partial [Scytalidium lignicola]
MEIVTGIFGRLEFITSGEVALTRIGELARIARAVLEQDVSSQRGDPVPWGDDIVSVEIPDFDLPMLIGEVTPNNHVI